MIQENKPISMIEAMQYLGGDENEAVKNFIKKFSKLNLKKVHELRKKIEELDMLKVKPKHIVKIIDFMPEDKEDLNKIFTEVNLTEDESKKILEIIGDYK